MKIMKKKLIILLLLFSLSNPALVENSEKKEDFDKIIEQFILNNPEIIIKSLEQFSKNKDKLEKKISLKILNSYYKDKIYNNFPSIGNKDTDIILTEFIDYNCGYCKKTLTTIVKLAEEIKDLKVVFIDYPILSESSELAARAALAANNQEAYFKYHSLLLEQKMPITEDYLLNTAKKLNLDLKKFKEDIYSDQIKDKIGENIQIAQSLQIRGTPTFLLGKNILPGAYDYNKLKNMILEN